MADDDIKAHTHTRRGFRESDTRDFSSENLARLTKAAEEMSYLLDHAYPRDSALHFVGNRYQFTQRQRLLLARWVSGRKKAQTRRAKQLVSSDLRGADVLIDGFNLIITLEVTLCGSLSLHAQDDAIRDLAGLAGTYRIIDRTPEAISLALDHLGTQDLHSTTFFLDTPVSNSGNLAALIERLGKGLPFPVEARTVTQVDKQLFGRECVVSSDSLVLDKCISWYNLASSLVERMPDAWVVDLHDDDHTEG